jgi:hypothetical protein
MGSYRKILKVEKLNLNCPECNSNDLFFNNSSFVRCNSCNYSFFTDRRLKNKSLIDLDILQYNFKKYKKIIMIFSASIFIPFLIIILNSAGLLIELLTVIGIICGVGIVGYLFVWWFIARYSCPKCKTRFSKVLVDKEFLGADRMVKTNSGTEIKNRYKNTFKCNSCNYRWWEEHTDFW